MSVEAGSSTKPPNRWRRAIPWLLIIPYIGTLWVSTYTSVTPEVWGIPFFYWYQFLWIAISAAITIVVYLAEDRGDTPRGGTPRSDASRSDASRSDGGER